MFEWAVGEYRQMAGSSLFANLPPLSRRPTSLLAARMPIMQHYVTKPSVYKHNTYSAYNRTHMTVHCSKVISTLGVIYGWPNEVFKQYKTLHFIKSVYSQHKTECSDSCSEWLQAILGSVRERWRKGKWREHMLRAENKFAQVCNDSINS
jgi:hypothetical protein